MSANNPHAASLTNHKASVYRENANFVYSSKFTDPLMQLLDAKPGQRIVDLGCGSGELTGKLAKDVGDGGMVLGVDSSDDMVSLGCARGILGLHLASSARKGSVSQCCRIKHRLLAFTRHTDASQVSDHPYIVRPGDPATYVQLNLQQRDPSLVQHLSGRGPRPMSFASRARRDRKTGCGDGWGDEHDWR
jgi:hypothetical protein